MIDKKEVRALVEAALAEDNAAMAGTERALRKEAVELADANAQLADDNAAMAGTERFLRKAAQRQAATLFFEHLHIGWIIEYATNDHQSRPII